MVGAEFCVPADFVQPASKLAVNGGAASKLAVNGGAASKLAG